MNRMHASAEATIRTLAVVDDDKSLAEIAGWQVEEAGYQPFIVEGSYQNINALANCIVQNAEGAICDHRLSRRGLANFPGAQLVAELFDREFPAILTTQYIAIDTDVSIRRWRHKIPVLLSRDETNALSIRAGLASCLAELRGNIPMTRRPHRVLIRITDLGEESGEEVVDAIVPSWNPKRAVRFPISLVKAELRNTLTPDLRLFALVNIGAETADELYFGSFELAPEPDEDDGLA
jgi:hypothetical protein